MKPFRFLTVLALLCTLSLPVFAQKRGTAAQESKKAKLEREIAILDKQLKETSRQSDNALSSLRLVRRKVDARRKLVSESDRRIAGLDGQIAERRREINALEERLDTLSRHYERLVRSAYRNRDARLWYLYLLGSGNLSQATHRYAYLKSLSAQMNSQARRIRDARSELVQQKAALEDLRHEAGKLRSERVAELGRLQKEEGDSKKLVDRLKKDKSRYQRQLSAKRKQVEALNREMARLVSGSAAKPRTAVDVKLDAEFASNQGKLPWPADGVVVDSFGEHAHPVYSNVKMPFNNGVGIAVPKDAPVKAVFDGTVRQIIVMPGYNQCILVQHGGYFTFYCKLSSVGVKAGEKVKTGQVLGRVDTIAGETQLHFELWEGRTPRDPETWLR